MSLEASALRNKRVGAISRRHTDDARVAQLVFVYGRSASSQHSETFFFPNMVARKCIRLIRRIEADKTPLNGEDVLKPALDGGLQVSVF